MWKGRVLWDFFSKQTEKSLCRRKAGQIPCLCYVPEYLLGGGYLSKPFHDTLCHFLFSFVRRFQIQCTVFLLVCFHVSKSEVQIYSLLLTGNMGVVGDL